MKRVKVFRPGIIAVVILVSTLLSMHACRKRESWPCDDEQEHCLRVVEQATGRPVEGATVYLMSKTVNSVPEAAYNLTTDKFGKVEWECSWAITDVCAEAGERYWDVCGQGYSINDQFLNDDYYELRPKAWVRVNVVDTFPLQPEIQVIAFTDYDDSYESVGIVPQGYFDVLGVVGGIHSMVRFKRFDLNSNFITGDFLEVNVTPGDTLELTYYH